MLMKGFFFPHGFLIGYSSLVQSARLYGGVALADSGGAEAAL